MENRMPLVIVTHRLQQKNIANSLKKANLAGKSWLLQVMLGPFQGWCRPTVSGLFQLLELMSPALTPF